MAKTLPRSYFRLNGIIHTAGTCTPYTYLIGWKEFDTWYYGVRYADNSHPDDFWILYKTSSKYVQRFISEHGEPDVKEIRKVFSNKSDARNWEEKVLTKLNILGKSNWLNRANNGSFKGIIMDVEIRDSIRTARLKNKKPPQRVIHNGTIHRYINASDDLPDGWLYGHTPELTIRQSDISKKSAAARTPEELIEIGKKISKATKGVPKPEGMGAKLSKTNTGVPRPYMLGDKNPAKKQAARDKIAKSWETREIGIWFTDEISNFYIKSNDKIDPSWRRGRKKIANFISSQTGKKYYNNGIDTIFIHPDTREVGWILGKIYKNKTTNVSTLGDFIND